MLWIVTAAVVVGIVVVDRAWTYRQVNAYAAATGTLDLGRFLPGDFFGLQGGLPKQAGIGHRRNAEEADRHQASRQTG
jgi:hypothetical protein